jgi:hypothetical protein
MQHIAIVYHKADFDGQLSNKACRYHLQHLYPGAVLHSFGWDFGLPLPLVGCSSVPFLPRAWSDFDQIYIVDLAVDALMRRDDLRSKIVWIDHHKSSIEQWDAGTAAHLLDSATNPFAGYRLDGVAACRLCWQFFLHPRATTHSLVTTFPRKDCYVARTVTEPRILRLAGEYDVWDHRDPDAKALQFGLKSLTAGAYASLIAGQFRGESFSDEWLSACIEMGYTLKNFSDKQNAEYAATYSRSLHWEGLCFCCLNTGQRGNSDLFTDGIKPEHQACFGWRHVGDKVMVSLYHVPGNEHLDLSSIATRYGGGGHRGASGFLISLSALARILGD